MTKEEIKNIDVTVFEEKAVVMGAEDYAKLWLYVDQLQQENEALESDNLNVKDLLEENEKQKQKQILDILKPHIKMVQDTNGLVGLEYDMSALNTEEKLLIKEWLEND